MCHWGSIIEARSIIESALTDKRSFPSRCSAIINIISAGIKTIMGTGLVAVKEFARLVNTRLFFRQMFLLVFIILEESIKIRPFNSLQSWRSSSSSIHLAVVLFMVRSVFFCRVLILVRSVLFLLR